jgi:hypothetical protein
LEFSEAIQVRPQFIAHTAKLRHPLFLDPWTAAGSAHGTHGLLLDRSLARANREALIDHSPQNSHCDTLFRSRYLYMEVRDEGSGAS